jgi:class 3 adenylate cyclase/tetratricopeptide (TPR) repeat protein
MAGSVTFCSGCGARNQSGARFCTSCGRSLAAADTACPACSIQLPAGSRFCFNCGHQLAGETTHHPPGRPARQVTAGIADQLRASGPGERRRITLLFCDVQDSTATAEQLDPEDWADIMRGALSRFIAPVERYGGTVARILGDAILAYFGAPVSHEDDPQRAVLAGLGIIEACRDLVDDVQRRFGLPFGVRVGINTGLVVVGDVGSTLYGEYAALGDAANVAARMEQTAQAGTVRIAEATHRLVAPLFDIVSIGPVPVKGKRDPLPAYQVLRPRAVPGSVRGIAGLRAPLVGRDSEMARLRAIVQDLVGGRGAVVSLIGEAGLGKSRLVAEAAAGFAASAPGGTWIAGSCFSYEGDLPYAPWMRAMRPFFGVDAGDEPQAGGDHERVASRLTDLVGADGRRQAAYLSPVVGTAPPPPDQEFLRFLEPAVLRQRTFAAVGALVEALATRGPVVVTLDDLHWSDATSRDLVQSLLPLTGRLPLVVLLGLRDDTAAPSWGLHEQAGRDLGERYTAISLAPLPPEASRELVAHLLRIEGLSTAARDLILHKAEGNPFFVEEVIRSLLDAEIVVASDGRFVVAGDIAEFRVPDTLVGVLATRIDSLEPATRTVLQTAAVVGREFGQDMLAHLVDDSDDLEAALQELQVREMVVETAQFPERTFAFKHALIRDAGYDTLLLSTRRDLHRSVGKLIEERDPERVHDLAHHFLQADELFRALPYLVAAGERSFAAFALPDAARQFARALEIWSEGQDPAVARRAYEGLGGARMFSGDMAGALDAFTRLEAFADEHHDAAARTSALNKQAMVHMAGTGNLTAAERALLAARRLAVAGNDLAGLAEFHVGYCMYNVTIGDLEVAADHLGEAAEVCFDLDPFHRNFGLTHYANTLVYQLRLDEARTALARAERQARADGDRLHQSHIQATAGYFDLLNGDLDGAFARGLDSLRISVEIGTPLQETLACWVIATVAEELGRYESAVEHLERAATVGAEVGIFATVAYGQIGLASVHQAVHGPGAQRTIDLVSKAQATLRMPLAGLIVNVVQARAALILLAEGDLAAAGTAAREAVEGRSATMLFARPSALFAQGRIALASGDPTGLDHLREAAAFVDEHRMRHAVPLARLSEAIVASRTGDVERTAERLRAADDAATRMGMLPTALRVRAEAIRLLSTAGRQDEARGYRDAAADAVAAMAAMIRDANTREAFLRTNSPG